MRELVHDIRNQLTVAIGNVQAIIDGKLPPTPGRLRGVLAALHEVDVLVGRFDGVTSGGAAPARVDVCALIERETVAMEAQALARDIDYSFDRCDRTHAACAAFRCDPSEVSRMVQNLLVNAVRYTPAGGAIHVGCHREPGVLALTVRDDGPGVQVAERDAIFEHGRRGSAAGKSGGSGFGLAVVRDVVTRLGGDVVVAEAAGGGALFTVRLPGEAVL